MQFFVKNDSLEPLVMLSNFCLKLRRYSNIQEHPPPSYGHVYICIRFLNCSLSVSTDSNCGQLCLTGFVFCCVFAVVYPDIIFECCDKHSQCNK